MRARHRWRWWAVREALTPWVAGRRYTVEIGQSASAPVEQFFWTRTNALRAFADAIGAQPHYVRVYDEFTGVRILDWRDPRRGWALR